MANTAMLFQWGAWIVCTMVASVALLKAWNGWLALKRLEIDAGRSPDTDGVDSPAGRISLADLRQRVRRLEAIAEGIDIPDARSNRGR